MTNQRYRNIYLDNHYHFCTASTVQFLPLFSDEAVCLKILKCWDKQRIRYGVRIGGFVIMLDHIHLLVSGSTEGVRKFMQYSLAETSIDIRMAVRLRVNSGDDDARKWLGIITARANGGTQGKVWKERFRCFPMDNECAVREKLAYIHNNPVKRGLVDHQNAWTWSSASHYNDGRCVFQIDEII